MLSKAQGQKAKPGSAAEKLVFATLEAWEREGAAGVAARAISRRAALPVSSIYYHFGDLEQLLLSAQAEALLAAERWCAAQIDALEGGAKGPGALGPLLAGLIDDWTETQRCTAFARSEGQLMALRDARFIPTSARWNLLWQHFWHEVCDRIELTDVAMPTAWLFDSTCRLHLMRWRRPVDRAALSELCDGWARWLDGGLAGAAPWFDHGSQIAARLLPLAPLGDATADTVATAAAAVVAQRGVAALTHRAVAVEAGVTLGIVSYKYRTSEDLLRAAFDALYRRLAPAAAVEPFTDLGLTRHDALLRVDAGFPSRENLLASDELIAATARVPAFRTFAAQLRYHRGRTSGPVLQALLGKERPVAPIDAAILSGVLSGRSRAYVCGDRVFVPDAASGLTGDLSALLARLGTGQRAGQ